MANGPTSLFLFQNTGDCNKDVVFIGPSGSYSQNLVLLLPPSMDVSYHRVIPSIKFASTHYTPEKREALKAKCSLIRPSSHKQHNDMMT